MDNIIGVVQKDMIEKTSSFAINFLLDIILHTARDLNLCFRNRWISAGLAILMCISCIMWGARYMKNSKNGRFRVFK